MRAMPITISLLIALITAVLAQGAQQTEPAEEVQRGADAQPSQVARRAEGARQAQEAQRAEKAVAGVEVTRAVVAVGVVARNPVGAAESFPAEIGTLYFFNVLEGAFQEVEIEHVWLREGVEVARVPLQARGPHWRTWSLKQITPESGGRWTVQVVTGDGRVLHSVDFTVDGPAERSSSHGVQLHTPLK